MTRSWWHILCEQADQVTFTKWAYRAGFPIRTTFGTMPRSRWRELYGRADGLGLNSGAEGMWKGLREGAAEFAHDTLARGLKFDTIKFFVGDPTCDGAGTSFSYTFQELF